MLIICRSKLYYTASGIITTVGGSPVHRTATYRCDDTRCCIIEFWPPGDEHIVLETCRGMWKTYYKTRLCVLNCLITNKKKLVLEGIFCDLVNAFDCVNHEILLAKFLEYLRSIWRFVQVLFNTRQKLRKNHHATQNFFAELAYIATWSSPRINSRA